MSPFAVTSMELPGAARPARMETPSMASSTASKPVSAAAISAERLLAVASASDVAVPLAAPLALALVESDVAPADRATEVPAVPVPSASLARMLSPPEDASMIGFSQGGAPSAISCQ
ncbi:MAG: hypothetical protein R3D33_10370 [Hyphomicrobiaceae bacterium]